MNRRNYARFYALTGSMPAEEREELKEMLVRQYTGGRTVSLREMEEKEYDAMCGALSRMAGGFRERERYRETLRRKRSAVLKLLQLSGIDTTDWNRVDAYCKDPRISGKVFRDLTEEELDMLNIKLRIIRRKGKAGDAAHRILN